MSTDAPGARQQMKLECPTSRRFCETCGPVNTQGLETLFPPEDAFEIAASMQNANHLECIAFDPIEDSDSFESRNRP